MALSPVFVELKASTGEFTAKLKEAERHIDHLAKQGASSFDKLAAAGKGAMLGVGALGIGVGAVSLEMADTLEKSRARMEQSLKTAGEDFEALKPHLDSVEQGMEKLGFTNAQVEEAFGTLVTATGSSKKAFADLSDAANLATWKHLSLADAAQTLARAQAGSVRALKDLGINLQQGVPKAQALADALERLHGKLSGQAAAAADTFAGKVAAVKAQAEDLAAKLGIALIPVLEKLATIVEEVVGWFEKHRTTAKALAAVVAGALVTAMAAYIAKQAIVLGQMALLIARTVAVNAQFLIFIARNWGAATAMDAEALSAGRLSAALAKVGLSLGAALGIGSVLLTSGDSTGPAKFGNVKQTLADLSNKNNLSKADLDLYHKAIGYHAGMSRDETASAPIDRQAAINFLLRFGDGSKEVVAALASFGFKIPAPSSLAQQQAARLKAQLNSDDPKIAARARAEIAAAQAAEAAAQAHHDWLYNNPDPVPHPHHKAAAHHTASHAASDAAHKAALARAAAAAAAKAALDRAVAATKAAAQVIIDQLKRESAARLEVIRLMTIQANLTAKQARDIQLINGLNLNRGSTFGQWASGTQKTEIHVHTGALLGTMDTLTTAVQQGLSKMVRQNVTILPAA